MTLMDFRVFVSSVTLFSLPMCYLYTLSLRASFLKVFFSFFGYLSFHKIAKVDGLMFPMKFITSYVCDFLKIFLSFILRGLVGLSCIRLSNDLIRIEVRICAQNGVR